MFTDPAKLRKNVPTSTHLFTGFLNKSLKFGFYSSVAVPVPDEPLLSFFFFKFSITLFGSLIKKREAAESKKERTPRTEKVFLQPIAFIKIIDRDDIPHPT